MMPPLAAQTKGIVDFTDLVEKRLDEVRSTIDAGIEDGIRRALVDAGWTPPEQRLPKLPTRDQLVDACARIAERISKNANAPAALIFPHLYLGLTDFLGAIRDYKPAGVSMGACQVCGDSLQAVEVDVPDHGQPRRLRIDWCMNCLQIERTELGARPGGRA